MSKIRTTTIFTSCDRQMAYHSCFVSYLINMPESPGVDTLDLVGDSASSPSGDPNPHKK